MTQQITNKTLPTKVNVADFLNTVSEKRKAEAEQLIQVMRTISHQEPVMWGPSIIGFGKQYYKYDTGREGDMPELGFSPRKNAITIYFSEGFDRYDEELVNLGKYKNSVSCLYINKLTDIDMKYLKIMLERSYLVGDERLKEAQTVEDYIASVPSAARTTFNELRMLVQKQLPKASEVLSYGIIGYKIDEKKRARVYISGWKDHVAMYPIPSDETLIARLKPYIKGKGTLWFPINQPLPIDLIREVVDCLVSFN